jgi:hypothetical protein
MKKLIIIAVGLALVGNLSVFAKEKKEPTAEQKKIKEEMVTKYDTNKDGKVDKDEAAKISDADKAKLKEAHVSLGGGGKKKKSE